MDETSSISIRLKKLYLSSQWSDLEFNLIDSQTGKTVTLNAHRLILAPCSPVFEALCYGPMAEKGKIFIEDIEPNVFDILLQFLYTDIINFDSVDLASNIIYAAKKYLLPELSTKACKYVLLNIEDNNCIELYNFGDMLEIPEIVNATFDHIRRRFPFVMKIAPKSDISYNLMKALVTSSEVNCKEISLVNLAQILAIQDCESLNIESTGDNMRYILMKNNIYEHIRWNLLAESELQELMPGLLEEETLNTNFPDRNEVAMKFACVHRITEGAPIRQDRYTDPSTICTTVKVNRTVLLTGVYIYANCPHGDAGNVMLGVDKYVEKMQVSIFHDDKQLCFHDLIFYQEHGKPYCVTLNEGITLYQNSLYDIHVKLMRAPINYVFPPLSKISKNPSFRLVVETKDYFVIPDSGKHLPVTSLGVVTGFEFYY